MEAGKLEFKLKALILALHISQFIAMGFFLEALVAILRKNNMPLENLGLIYSLGLFGIFRFLWAPFIDKIKFDSFGHYRAWIILIEVFILITLVAISLFDVTKEFKIVIILCAIFGFLASTQDIAIDALVYKICTNDIQRNIANSLKAGGGYIGTFIGGGLVLILYDKFDWAIALSVPILAYLISFYFMMNFKEPNSVILDVENRFILKEFIYFWKGARRIKWLIFLLLAPVTYSMGWGIMHPMLVDGGLKLRDIGISISIVGCLSGALSSFLSAKIINKIGKKKFLIITVALQGLSILILLFMAGGRVNILLASLSSFVIMFFSSPVSVVVHTYIMDEIDKKKLIGSQYSIQHCIFGMFGIISAGLGISMAGYFGYKSVIITGFVISLLTIYLAYTKKDK